MGMHDGAATGHQQHNTEAAADVGSQIQKHCMYLSC